MTFSDRWQNAKFKTEAELRNSDIFSEYLAFMHDPENIQNCRDCPENRKNDFPYADHPCGQQNCWVLAHIKED